MKKIIILAAAALVAMCACTKNEVSVPDQEIAFQAVNYVGQTKALEGAEFTYDHFGVYAWSAATAGAYYMDNETIKKDASSNEWKPSTTYYWPKKANVDFISYYPREAAGGYVNIEEAKISYTDFNAVDKNVDLLYADKVVDYGYADNVDGSGVTDGTTNNYKSVPAFFHHALASLNVIVKLAYRSKTVTEKDGSITKYKWEATVDAAELTGITPSGSLTLNLSDTENESLAKTYPWLTPANGLWTASGTPVDVELGTGAIYSDQPNYILKSYYVIPQAIENQKIKFTFSIKTYRGLKGAEPTLFLNENNVVAYADLTKATTVTSWKINQATTYIIKLAPTAGSGGHGSGSFDPEDPDAPDPDDPDLKDVEIAFDPAVEGWDAALGAVVLHL